MAHVGKVYPYADFRDYSMPTTLMQWLPRQFVIRANRRQGEAGNPPTTDDWFSGEPTIDQDAGFHLYEWAPGGWTNFPLTLWYKASLLFQESPPRRFEMGWTYKGVSNSRVVESQLTSEAGMPTLFTALQLGLGTGEGITITSNAFITPEAARWTDF